MSMKQIKCSSCQLTFSTNNELMNHIRFSTGKCATASHIIICQHCNKQFMTKKGLEYHLRMNPYCSALEDPHKMSLVGIRPYKRMITEVQNPLHPPVMVIFLSKNLLWHPTSPRGNLIPTRFCQFHLNRLHTLDLHLVNLSNFNTVNPQCRKKLSKSTH